MVVALQSASSASLSFSSSSFSQGKGGIVSKVPPSCDGSSPTSQAEGNLEKEATLNFVLPERLTTENTTDESFFNGNEYKTSVSLRKL